MKLASVLPSPTKQERVPTPAPSTVDIAAGLRFQQIKQAAAAAAVAAATTTTTAEKRGTNGTTILLDIGNASDYTPSPSVLARNYQHKTTSRFSGKSSIRDSTVNADNEPEKEPTEVNSNKKWHTHHVCKSDSLLSLSVRYNVNVGDIKRWNKLPASSNRKIPTASLKILINPSCPTLMLPDPLEQNISKLRQATKLSYVEAKFYLDSGKKSYVEALAEAQSDLRWEQQQQQQHADVACIQDAIDEDIGEAVPLLVKKME